MDCIVSTDMTAVPEQDEEHDENPLAHCRILGVYCLVKAAGTGHGATARTYEQKTLWFVRRTEDDEYVVQALNANSIPSGPLTIITKGEFIKNYTPEVGYYEKRCRPFIDSLQKKLDQADKYLAEDDLDAAEKEFCKALLLDEKHPKANIELGKIHLQKGDGKKLAAAMRRLMSNDAIFQEQERHLFNEFGISLRKEKHFPEAIAFYGKALEHNGDDAHLHFNIARALAESGNLEESVAHLETALSLDAGFDAALKYRDYLAKNGAPGAASEAGAQQ